MIFTEFSLLDLQLEIDEVIEFANCQIIILGNADSVKQDILKKVVLYLHQHFHVIKEQMVDELDFDLPDLDNEKITFHEFTSNLELSSILLYENNDVEILIDSEKYFFGHYIIGVFSNDWKFKGSSQC